MRMSSVEEWLSERHKLSKDDKRVLEDLRARARFALYCQIGSGKGSGGTCIADFGALVAKRAPKFGVEVKDLLQELLTEASEAARQGDWDL
jgi:hypothetical protein